MGNVLKKYVGSLQFWVLIVIAVYFAYGVYFAASGMRDSIGMLSNDYVYTSLSQNPWWWMVLFYGSEGIGGSISIISRAVAGAFAFYAALLYWRKKDISMPTIRKSVSAALLFEAIFFLALIPSIVAAVTYNLTNENLFYFGHTPELLLLYCTILPILAIVLTVPPLLLKLRKTIKHEEPQPEIVKWACLTAVAYMFVVFWFTYCMFWMGETVPYPGVYPRWGLDFVLQPVNLLSFTLTVLGLLATSIATLRTTLPAIKKQTTQLNFTHIGSILATFGAYFIFNVFYYYSTGGYNANPSVWYEVIGPLHNPNLWTIALAFLGTAVLIHGKTEKK